MARSVTNLQETFLNLCRKEGHRCIIYLVNGVQLRGAVKGFDNFTILLEDEGKQQIVYKHAVTTVQPMRPLGDVYHAALAALTQDAEEPEEGGPE